MNKDKETKSKLKLPRISWPMVQRSAPIVVGLALSVLFIMTALTIKRAVTVQPAANSSSATTVVSFDENTIKVVKGLLVVPGTPNLSNLGKSDPFN